MSGSKNVVPSKKLLGGCAMFKTIKVAAVSMKPTPWDKAGNADRMEGFIRQAASEGPDLIVLPEGLLEGYLVEEVMIDPSKAPAFMQVAEPIDGPYISRFQALARELGVCLCFGFAERIGAEGANAAIFLDHEGNICGKHHKTCFGTGYHESFYFKRLGKKLRAFDTPLGRCGIIICRERFEPIIARTIVLDGARLLLIVSYGRKDRGQNEAVLAIARENGVPIVEANVGMNLIISKGEIVGYKWGNDRVTIAQIDVPAPATRQNARASEQDYLAQQGPLMEKLLKEHGSHYPLT